MDSGDRAKRTAQPASNAIAVATRRSSPPWAGVALTSSLLFHLPHFLLRLPGVAEPFPTFPGPHAR